MCSSFSCGCNLQQQGVKDFRDIRDAPQPYRVQGGTISDPWDTVVTDFGIRMILLTCISMDGKQEISIAKIFVSQLHPTQT
jgi:hypothetical protein